MTPDINEDPTQRVLLDSALRAEIKVRLEDGRVTTTEVVFLLTRMLPELLERAKALGHVQAAYDLARARGGG